VPANQAGDAIGRLSSSLGELVRQAAGDGPVCLSAAFPSGAPIGPPPAIVPVSTLRLRR
jgi:hypothetical protein